MAEKQTKKRKKKSTQKAVDDLSLEDVLAAGGDEDDFEMMRDVDASSDFVADEGSSENVEQKEIVSLIKELGLDKINLHDLSHNKEPEESIKEHKESDDLPKEADISSKKDHDIKGKKEKKEKKEKNRDSKDTKKTNVTVKESAAHNVSDVKVAMTVSGSERRRSPQQKMLIKCGGSWVNQISEEKVTSPTPGQSDLISQLQKEAADLLKNEVQIYEKAKAKEKSSDSQWLKSVVSSGTLQDKVAALTVQVQDSPVHRLKTLDMLLSMAKKKGRRESIITVDMLKELWMTLLLPDDRKLKTFGQHPLLCLDEVVHSGGGWDERDKRLILWHFEELLKQRYKEFIDVLERLLHDTLVNIRSKSLGTVFDLLSEKPEQEQMLLSLLVNKIGDPDRKVASKAVYLTRSLVTKHPNMKSVVTKEIEKLLYRPNVAIKAQYFAVCFLNQLILTKQDKELATRLISIYFSFFGTFLKKGDLEAKMLSALLTGVNRAFPFAKEEDEKYNEQLDTLFRAVHIGTFNTSVQALMLLFQVMESRQSVSDRFYQALYAKLLDPNLKTSSKQPMFLNVLYKSLKSDPSLSRVKAFVKRILQVCSFQQPSFICGALFMISELTKLKPGIKSLTQQPEEEDDEEHFVDIPDEDGDLAKKNDSVSEDLSSRSDETPTRHVDAATDQQSGPSLTRAQRSNMYKPQQRNPLYSGAENSCLWELNRLSRHYHPSVCHFATTLVRSGEIEYDGDPLQDFTLMRFLDRFVYKNPKQKERDHGGSLMQPKKESSRLLEEPVNTKAFLTKKEENIREDEIFFHRYFKQKAEKENLKLKEDKSEDGGTDQEAANFDNIKESASEEFDFASVLKNSKKPAAKKKKKSAAAEEDEDDDEHEDEHEGESGDEDMAEEGQGSSDDEFDYDAIDFSSDEEDEEETGKAGKKRKLTDKDYEKVLLENLSSDEFSDDETQSSVKKSKKSENKSGGNDVSSMFASAEQFAHLLENSHASRGGSSDVMREGASDKQLKWEDKKGGGDWGRGRGAMRGVSPGREHFNNRKPQNQFNATGRGGGSDRGRGGSSGRGGGSDRRGGRGGSSGRGRDRGGGRGRSSGRGGGSDRGGGRGGSSGRGGGSDRGSWRGGGSGRGFGRGSGSGRGGGRGSGRGGGSSGGSGSGRGSSFGRGSGRGGGGFRGMGSGRGSGGGFGRGSGRGSGRGRGAQR